MDFEPYHCVNKVLGKKKPMNFYTNSLQWVEPDEVFECIVSLKKKFANGFLERGIIKFNSPSNWEKYAIENTTGRGDILEGSYAAYPYDSEWSRISLQNKYTDSRVLPVLYKGSNLLHLKHKESMHLPCYCFYILRNKDFIINQTPNGYEAKAVVPCRYFRGLEDGRNWETENQLEAGEQLVSVVISDYEEFISRVKSALINMGILEKEIIVRPIKYEELDKPYLRKRHHPMELFVKDKQFSDQSEGRIVVHSKNKNIQNYLLENTIEIGSIEDIAYLDEHYYSGGMFITVKL